MIAPLDWLLKNTAGTAPGHEDAPLRSRFFPFKPKEVADAVASAVEGLTNWKLVSRDGSSLKAERSTRTLGFVDDVELAVSAHSAGALVDVKSASRLGRGDFGQNRRNITELLAAVSVELMDEKPPRGYEGLLFCHFTDHPFEKVAPLFFDPDFLPVISPPWLKVKILDKPDPVRVGARMRINVADMFTWEVQFVEWNPPRAFTDRQTSGPFDEFIHRHTFAKKAGGCVVCDRLHYKYKFGALGKFAGQTLTGARLAAMLADRGRRLDEYLEREGRQ